MKTFLKKQAVGFLVLTFIISGFSIVASAANNSTLSADVTKYTIEYANHDTTLSLQEYVEAAQYAYMDINTAPANLVDQILNAREKIIWGESWTVEAGKAWVETADGEIQELPEFYSIFPEDWDIPADEYVKNDSTSYADSLSGLRSRATYSEIFNDDVPLYAAGGSNASDFYTFRFAYPRVTRAYATSLPGTSVNIGFSTNGESVAYDTYMAVGSKLVAILSAYEGDVHGARCSTYSTTGTATMVIDYSVY